MAAIIGDLLIGFTIGAAGGAVPAQGEVPFPGAPPTRHERSAPPWFALGFNTTDTPLICAPPQQTGLRSVSR